MNQDRDPTAGFFQGRLLSVLLTSGELSDPVLIHIVVLYWLLTTDCDCIAIGLSLSLHSHSTMDQLCIRAKECNYF